MDSYEILQKEILIGIMILQEVIINKKNKNILFIMLSIILLLFSGCAATTDNTDIIKDENELLTILGIWNVAEYLGESTEFHEIEVKTNEQEMEEEEINSVIKENYLEKSFEISNEKVVSFSSPTELGYYCSDWDELFTIYRQPPDIWEGLEPPFLCISIQHEDFNDTLNFIVDNSDNAFLYVKGLFFRLDREIN